MLKPLTMCVSLAAALAASSVALAGGHPSPQVVPSGQVVPSHQDHCEPVVCKPRRSIMDRLHACMPKPQPRCYQYEWVLKKKRCGGGLLGMLHHRGGCDDFGHHGDYVYASGQYPSHQAVPTGQAYGAGQTYGTGQVYPTYDSAPGMMEPPPADDDTVAPPAPVVPSAYGNGISSLLDMTRGR